jgi:hypothetical protein
MVFDGRDANKYFPPSVSLRMLGPTSGGRRNGLAGVFHVPLRSAPQATGVLRTSHSQVTRPRSPHVSGSLAWRPGIGQETKVIAPAVTVRRRRVARSSPRHNGRQERGSDCSLRICDTAIAPASNADTLWMLEKCGKETVHANPTTPTRGRFWRQRWQRCGCFLLPSAELCDYYQLVIRNM